MPHNYPTLYIVVKDDVPLEWFQDLQSAIDFAESQPYPTRVYSEAEWDALVVAEIAEIWDDYFGKEVC
jgi:hypothetical protein